MHSSFSPRDWLPLSIDAWRSLEADLIGHRILGCRYRCLPNGAGVQTCLSDRIPEVQEIAIDFSSGNSLLVAWAMEGRKEGLFFELRETGRIPEDRFNVDAGSEWHELTKGRVAGLRMAVHRPVPQERPVPWAVGLEFEAPLTPITLALGETQQGKPQYVPDSLLVLKQGLDAESYWPPGSETSAFGRPT